MSSRGRLAVRLTVAALFALTLALSSIPQLQGKIGAQGEGKSRYFPESGHSVESPFLEFFEAHGGVRIFGFPKTQALDNVVPGAVVQYFQRARMEYREDASGGQMTLGKLAVEMGYSKPPLASEQVPPDKPFLHYFPESGHSSAYAFLAFYNANGGEPIFGYPISEPMWSDGRLTQYFERVRMEWWPERAPDQRVALTELGTQAAMSLPAEVLAGTRFDPAQGRDAPAITELMASASVKDPVTRQLGSQIVSVLVTDQTGNPVKDATVQVVVHSSMSDQIFPGGPTSVVGLSSVVFELPPDRPGKIVTIEVAVTHGPLSTTTQTSYMVWWGS